MYLRSVYSGALDQMEDLLSTDNHKRYPHAEAFTAGMLSHLQTVANTVERVSPRLFAFIDLL